MKLNELQIYFQNKNNELVPVDGNSAWAELSFGRAGNGVGFCRVSGECSEGFDPDAAIVLRSICDCNGIDYMASEAYSPYWCRPVFGSDLSCLPKKVQMLLVRKNDEYTCILPLCDSVFKTLIRGCDGGFEFYLYSNCTGTTKIDGQLAFVYDTASTPDALFERCAKAAAELLNNGLTMREERVLPEIFEYIGWCSWDAFPSVFVSTEGLAAKANEFSEKNVPIRYAVIDDMWADCKKLHEIDEATPRKQMFEIMHASRLNSFEGDGDRFPGGMRTAVKELKKAGIPYVGIWFPTTGYWRGIDPDGEFFAEHRDKLLTTESGRIMVCPREKEAKAYFSSICRKIKSWGADFVKIDNQGCHHLYRNAGEIGRTGRAMQDAIDQVTAAEFNGALINCMGMPSECMYNRKSSAVCRCSDDFQPENREWFAKHIMQCSYNGLLLGQYYVNDWDMWWTDDAQAGKNSLCRAVSGGPIYISDKTGRTKRELLMPLIFDDGRILRCDKSGKPTLDCLMTDPTASGRVFKIRNTAGGAGIVAVFNIDSQNQAVSGNVCPGDAGLKRGRYAYYEYYTGENGIVEFGESIPVVLESNDGLRLYTFVELSAESLAVFGRLDKMIGVKAVTSIKNGGISLYEGGKVGFISEKEVKVLVNGADAEVKQLGVMKYVELEKGQTALTVCFD